MRRLGEPLQTDTDLMEVLARLGVRPGQVVGAQRDGREVLLRTPNGSVGIPSSAAHHVSSVRGRRVVTYM